LVNLCISPRIYHGVMSLPVTYGFRIFTLNTSLFEVFPVFPVDALCWHFMVQLLCVC
jgi:hypothetical protein